ncbi:hypothetical protein EZ590_13010 [Listeria monocytogenes]|nr:hypothetical protein [Listeria monocytogenes]
MITKSHSLEKEGGFFSVENLWITSVDNLCVSSEYLVEKNNFDNLINKHRFIFEKNTFFAKI